MADLWHLRMEARLFEALIHYLAAYIVNFYARIALGFGNYGEECWTTLSQDSYLVTPNKSSEAAETGI